MSQPTKPYYFTREPGTDSRDFFRTAESFLEYLQGNDPSECGCEFLTDEQWARIAASEDEHVEY